ncbi:MULTISPECIES: 23S rRNA (adenine(2030)-N(6))-methyltransferase RlmJ [unclassified Gilliamella]|uniref:23S rRNA (adenine(2030)-N(6))-methyltransferase RlmJ n=1 Tax=unclassified Gilliamella TaxID=2685620 RepID=UPI00226AF094|nr:MULTISPECIES: 23S rRNA (adenine(2030)-N(6))-methyltransferase RlmJ [unclassified Gilliamella]MCX8575029.1 23S rRNA (adenine(2030)-N(6))-methyltransferase RlmJ [Gilliamella sp. B3831]MCX8577411.1 23S rRNA (adenine(2030)-N(6))-methyltransferase RlmJ [Gilliamella sp. B3815]MCX8590127.1 23S rRNA (adenine(2030)-N(6))-methyltransferase RlmJ [Gilliamella sp. B3812]MCX8604361.1 23S rRNA (adenine(2030)-N(6))-methyltransferase RlmJ [Gilliamella sp. B3823]MCX8606357.1 23S rRNA (adenine(2030)-N(6))-met
MLSYRHSYHAGNHADVLKHIVLTLCIESLKEKEKPFLYLDTHSGAGRYLLKSEHAEKTGEYLSGINLLWQQPDLPKQLDTYLSILQRYNPFDTLKYYPGSPLIAKQLLREQDKLNLTELHPTDYPFLRQEFNKDKRARVLREDGFAQLKSKLPPESRRGLILIDPSYEIKDDYQKIPTAINEAYKRFATGVYLIWYPVVSRTQTQRMIDGIVNLGIKRISQFELALKPDNNQKGMTASGMIVINPPWKLHEQMQSIMPWLKEKLDTEKTGNFTIKELVSE